MGSTNSFAEQHRGASCYANFSSPMSPRTSFRSEMPHINPIMKPQALSSPVGHRLQAKGDKWPKAAYNTVVLFTTTQFGNICTYRYLEINQPRPVHDRETQR